VEELYRDTNHVFKRTFPSVPQNQNPYNSGVRSEFQCGDSSSRRGSVRREGKDNWRK
jgi:hypothetical protein